MNMSSKEYFMPNGVELPFHVQGSPEPLAWNRFVPRFIYKNMGILNKSWFVAVIVVIVGCSKTSPIGGAYQTRDGHLSAVVLDSSLFLMIGVDTMILYDLKIRYKIQEDSNTFRIYNVFFYNSLDRTGYKIFEIPLRFEYDLNFGGTLMAHFKNNDSFNFGGYRFYNQKNENSKRIFENWTELFLGNTETKLRLNLQE